MTVPIFHQLQKRCSRFYLPDISCLKRGGNDLLSNGQSLEMSFSAILLSFPFAPQKENHKDFSIFSVPFYSRLTIRRDTTATANVLFLSFLRQVFPVTRPPTCLYGKLLQFTCNPLKNTHGCLESQLKVASF